MQTNKNLKTKIGIAFIILAIISPLFGFVVPFLGLSKAMSATLVGFFALGMPEIFLVIGGLLAGKEVAKAITDRVKKAFKSIFRRSSDDEEDSKE